MTEAQTKLARLLITQPWWTWTDPLLDGAQPEEGGEELPPRNGGCEAETGLLYVAPPHAIPLLTDAATQGCLLALLHEKRGSIRIGTNESEDLGSALATALLRAHGVEVTG